MFCGETKRSAGNIWSKNPTLLCETTLTVVIQLSDLGTLKLDLSLESNPDGQSGFSPSRESCGCGGSTGGGCTRSSFSSGHSGHSFATSTQSDSG